MIGLEINENSIRLVEVKESAKTISLVNAVVEEGVPSSKSIQKIFKTNSISDKNVYSVISGKQVVVHPKLFPVMSDKELREALFWEAKELIAFPLEQAAVSYKKIGERIEGGVKKLELLLVVIKKEQLQKLQNLLSEAGLKVKGVTVAPFAIWDLMKNKFKPAKEELYAVLDINTVSASLNVFKGENLKFVRNLTLTQGEKRQETLIQELAQTISYVSEKAVVPSVDHLFLLGNHASFKNLDKALAQALGIKVAIFDPFKDVEVKKEQIPKDHLGIAMGLALGKTQSLNLLGAEKTKSKENPFAKLPIKKITRYSLLALLVLFVLFFGYSRFSTYKKTLDKELKIAQAQVAAKQQPTAPMIKEGKKAEQKLETLRQILPSSFSLEELTYERKGNNITFVGTLTKQAYVGNMIYGLESSGQFKEVKVWEVKKEGAGVRIKITVRFKK